ncbi:hypothetical protein U1Q18_008640 [Sarracenia purpurea var. burkii]
MSHLVLKTHLHPTVLKPELLFVPDIPFGPSERDAPLDDVRTLLLLMTTTHIVECLEPAYPAMELVFPAIFSSPNELRHMDPLSPPHVVDQRA